MADHDGGPQHRDGHAASGQQALDFAAGAEVGGEVLILATEAAEVDDPFQTRLLGGGAERTCGSGVLALEVVVVEGVHEVVRRVHPARVPPSGWPDRIRHR